MLRESVREFLFITKGERMGNTLCKLYKYCIVAIFLTMSVHASEKITHDFNQKGFESYEWTLKTEGAYWGTLYSGTLNESKIHFKNKYGGEGYANKGAFVWNAPKGHIIVGVDFKGEVSGYLSSFNATLFANDSQNDPLSDYTIEWSKYSPYAGPWHSENTSLTFDISKGYRSIGIGFNDIQSDNTHQAQFSNVVIYTVPDVEIVAATFRHNDKTGLMNNSNWDYLSTGAYSTILYKGTFTNNEISISNVYGGETYPNRCAYRWKAPENEVITRVTFKGVVKGYLKDFKAALFSSSDGNANLDSYDIKWSKYSPSAGPWHTEDVTIDFLPQEEISAIALGLFDVSSDPTHIAKFSNIEIETQSLTSATFDYSEGTIISSNDWELKTSGPYWGTLYEGTLTDKEIKLKNKYGGEPHVNRGAYVWNAPENSVITAIRFKGEVAGYINDFVATLFKTDNPSLDLKDYDQYTWSKSSDGAGPWHDEYVYLTFPSKPVPQYGIKVVKSIGLGFSDALSDNTHQVKFSDIAIITSPENSLPSMTRGTDIIRSNEFRVDAYVDYPTNYSLNLNTYKSVNLNAINFRISWMDQGLFDNTWQTRSKNTFGQAHSANLPWTWFQYYSGDNDAKILERSKELLQRYGSTAHGFCVGDENVFSDPVYHDYYTLHHNQLYLSTTPDKDVYPESDELLQLGKLLKNMKSDAKEQLVYTVTGPLDMKYNEDNDYLAYLDRVICNARPDVLNYNHYPFYSSATSDHVEFFKNISFMRMKGLQYGIPYTSWTQGHSMYNKVYEPSESEIRFQAFTCLTYGFSGLSYWTYHSVDQADYPKAILTGVGGSLSSIGTNVKNALPEIKTIGDELIHMKSDAVYYIPSAAGNPSYTTPWNYYSGSDIVSINTTAQNKGFLLGLFSKGSDKYFMLTNGNCAKTLNAAQTAQSVTITFRSGVNNLQKLNRHTGNWETVTLSNNTLSNYTLPGGTGDLFRIP